MRLKKLLKNISYKEIKGPKDIEISSITQDSRLASFNGLFIARKGKKLDGSKFLYEAANAGINAVITDIYDPFLKNITQVIVDDVSLIEADIASNFYEKPSKNLFSIGITGTNGKTTTNYLIKHILDRNEKKSALIGTIEYILGDTKIEAKLTTPDSISIQKYLKEAVDNDLKYFSMEASSHGLDQNRLKNIDFNIAIFTNLTLDHLDYHQNFENYKNAKKKLFDSLNEKALSIVNIDDENFKYLIKDTKSKTFTYSTMKRADLFATDIKYSLKGTSFILHYKEEKIDFFTPLIGDYNIYNILAAISVGLRLKIDLKKLKEDIKNFKSVKGRLEKVKNNNNLNIFVDFAHTPDALRNVLKTLKAIVNLKNSKDVKKTKIINVFGCGGNRDKSKRPLMAKISEEFSDISIVTSDNPRSEDSLKIIDDIISGFSSNKTNVIIEKDRKKAIEIAIKLANAQDIIIITGKGHETYQIFENVTLEFDDRVISKQICNSL
ncbi:MAG: UDP-N-acetylmuramoyl-L-alanyl-D-glutamate--2,6-diaminopimelate ligase [Candidatus Anoxychlamydiales bacterium]|nr:UDP-N-acetylmuramoyl-L-alanyl-D-glutamate--2,6-diaminopimelate ligase [Candidatus Anoxychlamydiales bacterium]